MKRNQPTKNSDEKSKLRTRVDNLERGYKEILLMIENYTSERDYGLYASDREIIEKVHDIANNKINNEV